MVMAMRRSRGFTLIELLTVVGIAAILALAAIPNFTKMIATQRLKNAASNMQASLLTARSEGIKRNSNVCLSTSNSSCSGTGAWNSGWYIVDSTSGTTIGTFPAYLNLTITGPTGGVTYQSSGRISATSTATFKIASSSVDDVRCVNISVTGVPAIATSGC
jgi:type IV fimbrial biogenesis protein FimT